MLRTAAYYNVASAISLASTDNAESWDALFVGGAGDLKVDMANSGTVTLKVVAGSLLPIAVKKIYKTGTDATLIVGLRVAG